MATGSRDEREIRAARNQALFRSVNEKLMRRSRRRRAGGGRART